ncbi:unnamed protein product [Effrenium voratum]|uniref:Uncharacterized protein n=1 Tax=Effrenium voratum TaxID=2562239 RepID=A0AA36INB1_9DINO|nr:unnamed protein product [Effrenium voratum]
MQEEDGVETLHESFGQTIRASLCCSCCGLVLFFASIFLLGWNEFNFVRNQKLLLEVEDKAVRASCTPDPKHKGAIVYVSCPVASMYDFGPSLQQLQPFVDDNMTAMWISVKATTAVLCGNCKLLRTSTNGAHTKRVIGCNQTCIHLMLADLQTFKPLHAVRPPTQLVAQSR